MDRKSFIYFVFGFLIFLLSPLFSLPIILILVYERVRGSLLLLSLFMGFISYIIVPNKSMDLARYYEYYEQISNLSFFEFLIYLERLPDKIFYCFMFVFSQINLKFQWFLFAFSSFNYYVVFSLYKTILRNENLNKQANFFSIILILSSFGYLNYFASTRFTIALSFFILSVKFYFLDRRNKMIFFYLLSIFTHTAYFIFLPLFFVLKWFKNKTNLLIVTFIFSAISYLIPVDELLSLFSFNKSFHEKAQIYTDAEERKISLFPIVSYLLFSFVLLSTLFKLLKINTNKDLVSKIIFVCFLSFISIIITLPQGFIVFDRLFIIFKSIFAILFIYLDKSYNIDRNLFLRKILFISFLIYVLYSIILYKDSFVNLFNIDYLFFNGIFGLDYTFDMF